MSVGCGCWSSPVPTSRALWEHWPEVLSLWAWVSSGQMEREELHPQGALWSGESLELPPSPLTSSRWGPWCLMTSQCGSAEGHLQGQGFSGGQLSRAAPRAAWGRAMLLVSCCSPGESGTSWEAQAQPVVALVAGVVTSCAIFGAAQQNEGMSLGWSQPCCQLLPGRWLFLCL